MLYMQRSGQVGGPLPVSEQTGGIHGDFVGALRLSPTGFCRSLLLERRDSATQTDGSTFCGRLYYSVPVLFPRSDESLPPAFSHPRAANRWADLGPIRVQSSPRHSRSDSVVLARGRADETTCEMRLQMFGASVSGSVDRGRRHRVLVRAHRRRQQEYDPPVPGSAANSPSDSFSLPFEIHEDCAVVMTAPIPHRRLIGLEKLDRLYIDYIDPAKGTGTTLAGPLNIHLDATWIPDAVSSSFLQPLRLQATNKIIGIAGHCSLLDFFLRYRRRSSPVVGGGALTTTYTPPKHSEESDECPAERR
jgi:hypothetical protein